MINKITIIGVGLIGGSLAKALRERNLAKVVYGYGRDKSRLEKAQKSNIIDHYSSNIEEAIDHSDVIVIATPVGTFQSILEEIEPLISEGMIITDGGRAAAPTIKLRMTPAPSGCYSSKEQRIVSRAKLCMSFAWPGASHFRP